MSAKGLIEVFTSDCAACAGAVLYARQLAADGRHDVRVWSAATVREASARSERMGRYGIRELPAIVVDGDLLACCT